MVHPHLPRTQWILRQFDTCPMDLRGSNVQSLCELGLDLTRSPPW